MAFVEVWRVGNQPEEFARRGTLFAELRVRRLLEPSRIQTHGVNNLWVGIVRIGHMFSLPSKETAIDQDNSIACGFDSSSYKCQTALRRTRPII